MPRLNRVFEEFGIHHEEHDVPAKVTKSLEDKARKAAAKNAMAAVEAKKRKGGTPSKVVTKRQKMAATSVGASMVASVHGEEEVAENVEGGAASAGAESGGAHSAASVDLGGENLVGTAARVLVDLVANPSAASNIYLSKN
jgi:hypothetical protein